MMSDPLRHHCLTLTFRMRAFAFPKNEVLTIEGHSCGGVTHFFSRSYLSLKGVTCHFLNYIIVYPW